MEIGTGIFLASVVLGTVALFIATKDRWSWKKITARTLLSIVALGVLVPGWIYVSEWQERRPRVDVSLWEIRLEQSEDDVRFLKGRSRFVWEASEDSPEQWTYQTLGRDGSYNVGFVGGSVVYVFYGGNPTEAPRLQGISAYGDFESITNHLGQPEKMKASEDGLRRLLLYPKWRTWFVVTGEGIVTRGIYDPSRWEPDIEKPVSLHEEWDKARPWEEYQH